MFMLLGTFKSAHIVKITIHAFWCGLLQGFRDVHFLVVEHVVET